MGCVYPRKNKLWIRFKDADGKWTQQKTTFHLGSEKKARRMLLDVEARIAAGAKFEPVGTSAVVTVAAYAREWLAERRTLVSDAGNDEARLKVHILSTIGSLLLEEVRPRHLVEMIRALRSSGKLAPKSIYNVYSTLRSRRCSGTRRSPISSSAICPRFSRSTSSATRAIRTRSGGRWRATRARSSRS
jgi:hypothetical protein